ncbi:MAG: hypothetical protein PHR25_02610 [Clostridia bacterium]|nr:hypothetical protein [Clostridia bacterium]MDD4375651.1 hypothetical protein [Clostridia bacterium]
MEKKKNEDVRKKTIDTTTGKKTKTKTKEKNKITDLKGNAVETEKYVKHKKGIKDHFRKFKKAYMLILGIIILISVFISSVLLIRNYVLNEKYEKFEKKMEDYGYGLFYNNESVKSNQKVTKLELVKIIIASVYNTTQVESIGFGPQGKYEGDEWVRTAEVFGIIDKGYVTKDNYNEQATYWDAIYFCLNARKAILKIEIGSKVESKFKNLQTFTSKQKMYINDIAEKELIPNNDKKLNIKTDLFKGQLNEIVVNFVEKYNTIAPEGEKIITKEESKPSNSKIYPYILYSVPKEVYEYTGVNEGTPDYRTPVQIYKYRKDYYEQVTYRSEYHYNVILNIDYKTITEESFKEQIDKYLKYYYDEEIKEYVKYVKDNEIQIKGTAKVQLPIFYLDGILFRSRLKLTFEVLNSKTDKNLLFADSIRNNDVIYTKKKYELYVDAPMGETLMSRSMRIDLCSIIDILVSDKEAKVKNEL